jgi:hypothetical protein
VQQIFLFASASTFGVFQIALTLSNSGAQRLLMFFAATFLGAASFATLGVTLQLAQVGCGRGCQRSLSMFHGLTHRRIPYPVRENCASPRSSSMAGFLAYLGGNFP